jgi:hypothetical protein
MTTTLTELKVFGCEANNVFDGNQRDRNPILPKRALVSRLKYTRLH